ncbi:MAG: M20/M25/M40 family metallo-hydrolase, partial [Planctomycetota bacterium]
AAGLDRYRDAIVSRLEAMGAATTSHAGPSKPDWLLGGAAGDPPPTVVCESEAIRDAGDAVRLLIAGHLDTVFDPAGEFREMVVQPDGKTAIGPGVVDMKGGILIAVVALEALHAAEQRVAWSFLLNSDEETGSFYSHAHLEQAARAHDVGIALEPALPGGALAVQRKGSGQFAIETFGRSAHAGREFEKGVSAVYALARALTEVEKMSDLERGVTVNVGPLRGGIATNAVPDHAIAWGNARYPDPQAADELGAKLDALATSADAMPRVVVHRAFNRPAKPMTPPVERLGMFVRDAAEGIGQSLPFESTGGVCDGNILQSVGLPTVDTLGVRGGGLHTTDEWIELDSLVERAQLLAVTLLRLSESPRDLWREERA